jgi:hypothetical protein
MKSGFKSTEFWLHILMAATGSIYEVARESDDPVVMLSLQLVAAVYTAARTYLKSRQVGAPTTHELMK